MNSFQQMSGTRREYRVKGWQKGLCLLLGGAAIAGGVFLVSKVISEPGGSVIAAITMLFPVLGLYLIAWAMRARLVVDGTRIEVRGALKERAADLSEIEGFRTISTRNGSYTQLCLEEGRGKITVSQSFDTDDDYRAWFQQVTDLDKRDRDALLDEISKDAELGATPEERLKALKQSKNKNIVAIVVTVAAAAGLNFGTANLRMPSAVALALTPAALLLLMQRSPLLYAIFKKKADPRADLGVALMISGIGLAFRVSDVEFVSMQPLLLLIVPVALVYTAAFYSAVRKNSNITATLLGLLFIAGAYSFGLAIVADTLLDSSKSTTYIVPVTGKHISSGRSTTYYLNLAPWGPLQEPNRISVSSSFYNDTQQGDQICLGLHLGRLNAPWYQLADCPATSTSEPPQ